MYLKFSFKGEHLWLRVSSVNNETVVGRVWSVTFMPGLLYGQMIQIPINGILDIFCEDDTDSFFLIYWIFDINIKMFYLKI